MCFYVVAREDLYSKVVVSSNKDASRATHDRTLEVLGVSEAESLKWRQVWEQLVFKKEREMVNQLEPVSTHGRPFLH